MKIKYFSPIIGGFIFIIFNYVYLLSEKTINMQLLQNMLLLFPILLVLFTIVSYFVLGFILLIKWSLKKYMLSYYSFLGLITILGIIIGIIVGLFIFNNQHVLLKSWLDGISLMMVFVFNTSFYIEFEKLEKEKK